MPMIDFTYPEGALEPGALATAVDRLTESLLRNEAATDNERIDTDADLARRTLGEHRAKLGVAAGG